MRINLCCFVFYSFSWFFGKISRKEAERLLLSVENPRGTFLVRNSEHNPNGFSLSVKDWEEARGYHPKHYKIKPLDNGGFYIATNQTFPSLQNLVMAYSSELKNKNHCLLTRKHQIALLFKIFCFKFFVIFFPRKCPWIMSCLIPTLS